MFDDSDLEAWARARLGTVLRDRYRLERILGIGGTAIVYLATHRNRADFAVKMLHPDLGARPNVRTRFLREGYAANSVKHPGVVRVIDDDVTEDGSAFLVMDLVDGVSCDHLLDAPEGRPSGPVVAAIGLELLDVLEAAHAAGIVHRDIKPANLFLTREGDVKVLDFGIARALSGTTLGSPQLTGAGVPIGTPAYMAPEQALAKSNEIDARTDVWAAGATLFALFTGQAVHPNANAAQVIVAAATTPARKVSEVAPGVPAPVAAVVDRALSFEREARWGSAGSMRAALAEACGAAGWAGVGSKAAIAALPALLRPARSVRDPALAPTAESFPSHPLLGPSREATLPAVSASPPLTTTRAARARTLRWAPALGAALVLVALLTAGAARRRHAKAASKTAAVASAPASLAPATAAAPIKVLVLGVENQTEDPNLDGAPDLILARALSRSPVLQVLAFGSLKATAVDLGAAADDDLPAKLAARDGVPVLGLRGAIAVRDGKYAVSVTAKDATGRVVFARTEVAADSNTIVPAFGRLSSALRAALGDHPPTDPALAEETGVSLSIDADHELFVGGRLVDSGKYDEAIDHLRRAVTIDPGFARGHWALASVSENLGRLSQARIEYAAALHASAPMEASERLELQADDAAIRGAYDESIEKIEAAIRARPHVLHLETTVTNYLVLANHPDRALAQSQSCVREFPRNIICRVNLAMAELRMDHLDASIEASNHVLHDFPRPVPHAYVFLALAEALRGDGQQARDAYAALAARAPSLASLGVADLALAEGRTDDALAELRRAMPKDEADKDADALARKQIVVGEAYLARGERALALAAVKEAAGSPTAATRYGAAEVLLGAGDAKGALAVARELGAAEAQDGRMYAKVLEGDAARAGGDPRGGLARYEEAREVSDGWLARVGVARAQLEMGAYEDAERSLRACIAEGGDGALQFDSDAPSLRLVPPLTYDLARAIEGQGRAEEARATYDQFLAKVPQAAHDPLADAARRKVAAR